MYFIEDDLLLCVVQTNSNPGVSWTRALLLNGNHRSILVYLPRDLPFVYVPGNIRL